MHRLWALAPLLVGLTSVFLAPTAQADCPHKGTYDPEKRHALETWSARLEEIADRF